MGMEEFTLAFSGCGRSSRHLDGPQEGIDRSSRSSRLEIIQK